MAKSSSSNRWLHRQKNDPFVKQAQADKYRSRAVYKLSELDQKHRLFKPGQVVFDLGAAPGSWSQYVVERVGSKGLVIAVDILDMEPIANVDFIHGDFTEQSTLDACLTRTDGAKVDIVISDMAPNISGIRDADQARSMALCELALDLAVRVLKPGGDLLLKVFQGAGLDTFKKELNEKFQRLVISKPGASRDKSRECYILARHIII